MDRLDALLATVPPSWRLSYESMVGLFEHAPRLRRGRGFSGLRPAQQLEHLRGLFHGGFAERALLRAVLTPLKVCQYDSPEQFERLGCAYGREPVREPMPRLMQERCVDADELAGQEERLEVEVVVVGSGAGGATVAAELAARGVAVVLLEEGRYHRRPEFNGHAVPMMRLLYRDQGMTGTVGNCVIPIPFGVCVGGTTTINSGTCYRVPPWVLRRWAEEEGLRELGPGSLDPYYDKVEQVLQVTPAEPDLVGGIGTVVGRGCDALGWQRHGPLRRNAPDCDGSSLCIFGCPTDAKRSTNVSYVPQALRYGAQLVTGARVERIEVEGGRAVGVRAVTPSGRPLNVRAGATVLAAGSLMSPTLLLRQGLANRSRQVGRNLSIHPAVGVLGLFDDPIDGVSSIPQGYGIEEFHREGLLFEGAFVPPDFGAGSVTLVGEDFTTLMEAYRNVGFFGFMVEDSSRGRVVLGPGGAPLMTYVMNDHDVAQVKRGVEILVRVFQAGGARRVFPQLADFAELSDERDLERFRRARLRARDFDLTAHHPLGTCRMGPDPRSAVVGPTHEAHDVERLFICDGSAVPSSLGVNPMLTIMALATRAAEHVARAIG